MKRYKYFFFLWLIPMFPSAYSQEIDNRQYKLLLSAVEKYQELLNKHDWPVIKLTDKVVIKLNDRSIALPAIKERLRLLGDLRRVRDADVYTVRMEEAVKQFQRRHGLEDDGLIGPAFIKALNTPLDQRIEQLSANVSRIMMDTVSLTGTRLVANIPEYKLYVFEDDKSVLTMDIVVGKASNPTVVFSDTLENIVFSPYWNVPTSIVQNEILPELAKNSSYLRKHNMEITGKVDGLPAIRQKPGPDNSLGGVKFLFPNQYNIYFHDTPAKSLFDRRTRAFSHGCIRLSQPFELAKYLLRGRPEWTDDTIRKAMTAGSEKWVRLDTKIPVSIIYYTAWVDSSGLVNFRDDIYGHD